MGGSAEMAEAERARRGKLKAGCFAAAGVAGLLFAAWALVLVATAYFRGRTEMVQARHLVQELPRDAAESSPVALGPQGARPAGRVVLDLTVGEFTVEPGRAGGPVEVTASYDTRSYALTESFAPDAGSGWIYHVTFEETSWFKDGGLRGLLGGSYPTIRVRLPPDVPLALEGRFAKGGVSVRLDGLWLTDVDLRIDKGALFVGCERPLAAPLERMILNSRQGGLFTSRLGNASPRLLEIDHWLGGLTVDLGGDWRRDAQVRMVSRLGGARVRLPATAAIEGLGPHYALDVSPAEPELSPPTLQMDVSSWLGRLRYVE